MIGPGEEWEWKGAWATHEMECVICGYTWVAVFPVCAPALECDNCGYMNAVPPLDEPDND